MVCMSVFECLGLGLRVWNLNMMFMFEECSVW